MAEGITPELFHAHAILRVYTGLPVTAFNLGSPIGETVNGCVTCRNLDPVRADVERKTTDKGSLAS